MPLTKRARGPRLASRPTARAIAAAWQVLEADYRAEVRDTFEKFLAAHPGLREDPLPIHPIDPDARCRAYDKLGDFKVRLDKRQSLVAAVAMRRPSEFLGNGFFELTLNTAKEPAWWRAIGNDAAWNDLVVLLHAEWGIPLNGEGDEARDRMMEMLEARDARATEGA